MFFYLVVEIFTRIIKNIAKPVKNHEINQKIVKIAKIFTSLSEIFMILYNFCVAMVGMAEKRPKCS